MNFVLNSVEDTINLGIKLGSLLRAGDIICLDGDLGTGKTHFSKGIAKGLGITDEILSPTFTIVNEYHTGRIPLFHFDVYRVNDPYEIESIGFDEYIFGDGASLIEWSTYIDELIPEESLKVKISKDFSKGENYRLLTMTFSNSRYNYVKEL